MRRTLSGVLLVAGAVVTAAGCATQAPRPIGPATGPARPLAAASQTPKQRAEADAAAILEAFVPPPGAQRLARPPNAPGGLLKTPITGLGNATQADGTTFWTAPGDPQALLAWEEAHIPRRFTLGDADFGPPAWDRMFQLPPIPGVLTSRAMVVEVVGLGNGQTGIRVDAEVGWQPPRPAADQVPPTAQMVTIARQPDNGPNGKRPPKPVTITDVKVVKKLAALVNGLPISPFNNIAVPCPLSFRGGLQLTFRARPSAPVLATALTDQACGVVAFTATGRKELELTNTATLDKQILAIAALPWKLS
jgi:hypothetical protein